MKKATGFLFLASSLWILSSCATPRPGDKVWREVTQKIGPVEFVPLMKVCELLKINYEWDALTRKNILYKNGSYLTFKTDDRSVSINGTTKRLSVAPRAVNGALMLPSELAQLQWWKKKGSLLEEVKAFYPGSPFVVDKVIIDAGHGGKDTGAVGRYGLEEKKIVLEIALKLRAELEALGLETILTREDDTYLSLPERAWVANNSGADLFVSVHANSAPDQEVSGTEIYFISEAVDDQERAHQMASDYGVQAESNPDLPNKVSEDPTLWDIINTENRQESIELARAINTSLKRFTSLKNRGIKGASFFVLKWTDKPAVLVETGFVTHREEARLLATPAHQDQLASLIAQGIMAYKAEYERTRGFTAQ